MSKSLTPEQRTLRAKLAAHASHKNHSGSDRVKAANDARFQKYVDQVDPHRKLPEAERLRRAKQAEKEEMTRLAFLSSKARSQRAKAGE